MESQEELLKRFKLEVGGISYKKVSILLNIQPTRTFRIFNGADMKISEYKRMFDFLDYKSVEEKELENLLNKCFKILPSSDQSAIKMSCLKKLNYHELKQKSYYKSVA